MLRKTIFIVLLLLFTIANLLIQWRRSHYTHENFAVDFPRAARIQEWNDLKRIPLETEQIHSFVNNTLKKQTLEIPDGVQKIEFDSLGQECKTDFQNAIMSLIEAYGKGTAESVFSYHTDNRGGTLDKTVKVQLLEAYKRVNNNSPKNDLDLLSFFWNITEDGGLQWIHLLHDTGTYVIWSAKVPLTQDQEIFLNQNDKTLFQGESVALSVFRSNNEADFF